MKQAKTKDIIEREKFMKWWGSEPDQTQNQLIVTNAANSMLRWICARVPPSSLTTVEYKYIPNQNSWRRLNALLRTSALIG